MNRDDTLEHQEHPENGVRTDSGVAPAQSLPSRGSSEAATATDSPHASGNSDGLRSQTESSASRDTTNTDALIDLNPSVTVPFNALNQNGLNRTLSGSSAAAAANADSDYPNAARPPADLLMSPIPNDLLIDFNPPAIEPAAALKQSLSSTVDSGSSCVVRSPIKSSTSRAPTDLLREFDPMTSASAFGSRPHQPIQTQRCSLDANFCTPSRRFASETSAEPPNSPLDSLRNLGNSSSDGVSGSTRSKGEPSHSMDSRRLLEGSATAAGATGRTLNPDVKPKIPSASTPPTPLIARERALDLANSVGATCIRISNL